MSGSNNKKKTADASGEKLVCRNKRASHDYHILDKLECGIVLQGTEVKSLREGQASLEDAFAKLVDGEVWLHGCDIPEYSMGTHGNHKPKRPRKLLMHRSEVAKFAGKASQQGFTLIPMRLYFNHGLAKVELAVAKGKQLHDKRENLKAAEAKREISRAMSRKRS